MSRHSWLAATGAALAVTVCGCLSRASTFADLPPLPAAPAAARPETTRAQMPDAPPPPNNAVGRLINLPVERPAEAAHANSDATIHAVVNGELITHAEVLISCSAQLQVARTPKEQDEILKRAVESLIDREVLLQEAISHLKRGGKQGEAILKKIQEAADEQFDKVQRQMLKEKHLSSRAELMDYMRRHHMSLELFRRWWERNWMSMQYLAVKVGPLIDRIGHTEVSEYYNSHRDEYMQPDSVDWQDIFLDAGRHASPAAAREFAEALVQRVQQGEDFTKLSAEFDNGESRWRKGAGQGHKRGEIFPPEAEPLLFQMHEGDMKIVERPHGYDVIRLVKRQYAGPIPFDAKVQKEIHDKLKNLVYQRERESILKDLKRKAVIDRCD